MVAVLGYSREQIAAAVRRMYSQVADHPDAPYHFPTGREACEALGYPANTLDRLPASLLASFAGVGNPFRAATIRPGHRVLDIGAGAGTDSLIASELVGPRGHVFALDLTPAMTRKLRRAITELGRTNLTVVEGSAEQLPFASASMDVITSNGALNLVPRKRAAVREMFRVLRPGGVVQIADVVIRRPVTVDCDSDPRLWVECVVGATVDEELLQLLVDEGFTTPRIVGTHDYFALSPSAQTREVAAGFAAYSVELRTDRADSSPSPLRRRLRLLSPMRWWAKLRRRGLVGMAGLIMALLTCYGTLVVLALLSLVGLQMTLNQGLWGGFIVVFSWLSALGIAISGEGNRRVVPSLIAVMGAGLMSYTMLVTYSATIELVAFLLLATAVALDLIGRRRAQRQLLGLRNGNDVPG